MSVLRTGVRVAAALAASATWFVALACGSGGSAGVTRLSIATGGTGGVYYPYGGAIANLISTNLRGVRATAEVTAASVDNLKLIRDRNADLAFTLADTLADAVRGQGAFARGGAVPARTLTVLYVNYTQLVARGDLGVARVGDLRTRTVSVGAAGSGTELVADRLLAAAGLDPARDIVRQNLGVAQSVDQFKDRKIDAFFWSGGLPTAAILDLATTAGVSWHLVRTDDLLPALQTTYGPSLYTRLVVPKDVYAGLAADVPVVGIPNMLVVHEAMPDQLAYDLTRLLFDQRAKLAAVHPEAARLNLEAAVGASPAPFHPGAIRYYRETGVWRD